MSPYPIFSRYLQMINAGERLIVNNQSFGYLSNRIVFYLLNLHIKSRRTYFARVRLASKLRNRNWELIFVRLEFLKKQTLTKQTPLFLSKERTMLRK